MTLTRPTERSPNLVAALQVVVKRGFSHDMADLLVEDLERRLPRLERPSAPLHNGTSASGFHH